MKAYVAVLIVGVLASACSHQAPTFSWYHPMGGEYLFSYDATECETSVTEQGLQLSTDTNGPFFQCMHQRGYYLVDGNGIVQEPITTSLAEGPQVSQQ